MTANIIEFKNNRRFFNDSINFLHKNEMRQYLFIFEEGIQEVSIYSDFFFDRFKGFCLLNKSFNTKLNFYACYVVRFLNFVFNESDTKIDNIEELTMNMVKEFLEKYSTGTLGTERIDGWKDSHTVKKASRAISYFVYWLWSKKVYESTDNLFKMKYIKKADFHFIKMIKPLKASTVKKEVEILEDIVIFQITQRKNKRNKVTTASLYTIVKLMELAQVNDPMLTFGIALGAFAGLRAGEIMQMHKGRLRGFENEYTGKGCYIYLLDDVILRSDLKCTGHIKVKDKQAIYEAFSLLLRELYQEHLRMLKAKKIENNIYGALFLNDDGNAMVEKTYLERFDKLFQLLEINMTQLAMDGDKNAIAELGILGEAKITPHSLRHFYSQYIKREEAGNDFVLAYYRRDKNISSNKIYVRNLATEYIRQMQNKVLDDMRALGWKG
jgi:integrase